MLNNMAIIDLSFTTIKQELPDFIYQKLASYSAQSNSYHHQPEELRELIAKKHDINIESISLTAGSDQAIMLLSSLYGRQGHVFTPTYISYTDVKRFGKLTEHVSLDQNGYEIATSNIEDASLIFLANPNNPAGITSKDRVLELVANNPNSLVVVDEAYGDFTGASVINEVSTYSNLVVLRSFSKGYALAGFRIGYMVAQSAILEDLVLESTWFNVAYTSVGAAIAAMENEVYFTEMRTSIVESRKQLESYLTQSKYTIIPSFINATLIKFSNEGAATRFTYYLETKDIKVNQGNGVSNVGLDKSFVRISIGTPEQMEVLRQTIEAYGSSLLRQSNSTVYHP
jgi:histidinol-phosphate aminotransferase